MTTEQKPTGEQINRLVDQLEAIGKMIEVMTAYHNKRADFFKTWNFCLRIIDILLGVGTLVFIGLLVTMQVDNTSSVMFSFLAAGFAVLLLFFSMLFDFSKKEESHRWLATIYRGYNKEISDANLVTWENSIEEEYKQFKAVHDRLKEGMNNLKREEYPILEFEFFLCGIKKKITEEANELMFLKIKWWQRLLANYFSMTNALARFLAKHNQQERQKQQQQAQQQQQQQKQEQPTKDNKDKKE